MKECKHEDIIEAGCIDVISGRSIRKAICFDCRQPVRIGPANDGAPNAIAVAIGVDAARWEFDIPSSRLGLENGMCMHGYDSVPFSYDQFTGWLIAELRSHDERVATDQADRYDWDVTRTIAEQWPEIEARLLAAVAPVVAEQAWDGVGVLDMPIVEVVVETGPEPELGVEVPIETADPVDDGPVCSSCDRVIDPGTCHCGEDIASHGFESGHSPVPMGCECHLKHAEPDAINMGGES